MNYVPERWITEHDTPPSPADMGQAENGMGLRGVYGTNRDIDAFVSRSAEDLHKNFWGEMVHGAAHCRQKVLSASVRLSVHTIALPHRHVLHSLTSHKRTSCQLRRQWLDLTRKMAGPMCECCLELCLDNLCRDEHGDITEQNTNLPHQLVQG